MPFMHGLRGKCLIFCKNLGFPCKSELLSGSLSSDFFYETRNVVCAIEHSVYNSSLCTEMSISRVNLINHLLHSFSK